MEKVIQIKNLDCAACAAELSEELNAIAGISAASADFINQRVTLTYESGEALAKAVAAISGFEDVEIVDGNAPVKKESRLKEILSIAVSAAFFIPGLVLLLLYGTSDGWKWYLGVGFCVASFLAAGWEVALNAGKNAMRAFKNGFHPSLLLDENLLMLVAAVGAIAIGEYMEAAAVVLLYQIGELLQSLAVGSSRGAIQKLMEMRSDRAIRLTDAGQEEVEPEAVREGDRILVRRGDKVPVDCVLEEPASLDTKSLTGESYLKDAAAGDEVLAGSVNAGNPFRAKAVRPYEESAVAKILDLVERSSAAKAKPEKFITKFARVYTPVVVLLAVLIAVIPPLWQNYNFTLWVGRALNFLVISCPCALIISVPLTYFSGVGALARCGVLTKGAVYLDKLAAVKVAVFDKTGTLTEGKFSVSAVVGGEKVLQYAAAAERTSSHPLAQAFAAVETPYSAEHAEEIAGMGVSAEIGGKHVLVGSARLLREHGIEACAADPSAVTVYVAEDGVLLGYVSIADALRPAAKDALLSLKKSGVERIAVLTGDTRERAENTLRGLPVDEICASLMPDEKPKRAETLKERGVLLYVGDGINDAPVMVASDVSAAMGGLGSGAAIEAADFVLAGDNLASLSKAVKGAKRTRRIVAENIVFSIGVKVALMALSLVGLIPLWAAVFGDVGVMLLAVLNSMRMRAKL